MPPGSSDPLWELGNRQKPSVINRIWVVDSTKGLDVAAPDETWCGYRADLLDMSSTYWSFDVIGGECVLLKKPCLRLKGVLRFLPVCAVSKVPFYAHLQEMFKKMFTRFHLHILFLTLVERLRFWIQAVCISSADILPYTGSLACFCTSHVTAEQFRLTD